MYFSLQDLQDGAWVAWERAWGWWPRALGSFKYSRSSSTLWLKKFFCVSQHVGIQDIAVVWILESKGRCLHVGWSILDHRSRWYILYYMFVLQRRCGKSPKSRWYRDDHKGIHCRILYNRYTTSWESDPDPQHRRLEPKGDPSEHHPDCRVCRITLGLSTTCVLCSIVSSSSDIWWEYLFIIEYESTIDWLQDWQYEIFRYKSILRSIFFEIFPTLSPKVFMPPHGLRESCLLQWAIIVQFLGGGHALYVLDDNFFIWW